jgi:hypothetical protein
MLPYMAPAEGMVAELSTQVAYPMAFKATLSKWSQAAIVFLIEDVALHVYAIIFVAVVFACALAYWKLAPENGIVATYQNAESSLSYGDAVYFSISTITSLGFGDIRPVGYSRAISCVEVLFGLFTLGIIIAKATSFRLSYHVKRLFYSSINERMQAFAQDFQLLRSELKSVADLASSAFDVPRSSQQKKLQAREKFGNATRQLFVQASNITEYVAVEIDYGRFFAIAPPHAAKRLADSVDETIFYLGTMIQAMSINARQSLLDSENRQRLQSAIQSLEKLHDMAESHCPNGDVKDSFLKLRSSCQGMVGQYFAVPSPILSQPNLQPSTDEPEPESMMLKVAAVDVDRTGDKA